MTVREATAEELESAKTCVACSWDAVVWAEQEDGSVKGWCGRPGCLLLGGFQDAPHREFAQPPIR